MKNYNFFRICLLLFLAFQVKLASAVNMPISGTSSITTCSGTVSDDGGSSTYSNNANGTLTINPGTAGSKVQLTFTSFSTETNYDFLYIYDGTSTSATLLGTYNGTISPGVITASASNATGALTLRFATDVSNTYSGFDATIACVSANQTSVPYSGSNSITACSGTVYDDGGAADYSNGANGTLTINPGTAGSMVTLNFSAFSTESTYDYLYIYDGTSTSATLLGTYTGTVGPGVITASNATGALTLRFTSDGSGTMPGFVATISCGASGLTTVPVSGSNSITTCSGTVYDDGGTSTYSNNANGTLTINPGTAGSKVQLNFTTFSTESTYDYLYIYDGTSTSATLIGSYSGTVSPGVITATNTSGALTLRFTTDVSNTYSGFAATISCVTSSLITVPFSGSSSISACSGTVYDHGGTGFYNNGANGTLTINPTAGSKLQLNFTTFSTESCCDYLQIYDGTSTTATLIGSYYGSTSPGTITATNTSGALTLRFYSDGSATYQGFAANISCITVVSPTISVSPTSLTAAINACNSTATQNVTINNTGPGALNWQVASLMVTDDFDPGIDNSVWQSITGGVASTSCGSVSGNALYFDGSTREAITKPMNTLAGGTINFALKIAYGTSSPCENADSGEDVILYYSTNSGSTWTSLQTFYTGSTYQNFTNISVTIPAGAKTSSTLFKWGQPVNSGSSTDNWSIDNVSISVLGSNFLTCSPTSGTVASGGSTTSVVTFSSTGLSNGTYTTQLIISSNDPVNPTVSIPVTLTVTNCAPTVDLIVNNQSLSPTSIIAGNLVVATSTVYNQGNSAAAASNLGYYLSTDNLFDASDVYLGNSSVNSVAAISGASVSYSLTIPSTTAPGTYYVLFKADYNSVITETNENNNVSYAMLTVTAAYVDLSITSPSLSPTSVVAGSSISVSSYTYNSGNSVSPSSYTGYYLSTNTTFDASDVYLGSSTIGSISAGYTYSASYTVSIPPATTVGTYYILFRADNNGTISESNESNNVAFVALSVVTPNVDLIVQSASLGSTSITAGNSMNVYSYTYNQGTTAAPASYTGYYLSTNTTYDAADVYLGSSSISTIAASSNYYAYSTLTIPSTTAAGTYYILFKADYTGSISESNESNNVTYATLTVTVPSIDLYINSQYVNSSSVVAGNSVSLYGYEYNTGNSTSPSNNVGFYLSTNPTYDAADIYLGYYYVSSISSGSSYYFSTSVSIPAGTPAATYYLLFKADNDYTVTETNENNNVSYSTLTVTAPPIDLIISSPSISTTSVQAGNNISGYCTVYNTGTTTSPSSNVGYYLSTDQVFDISDVYLNNSNGGALSANSGQYKTATLTIPSSTATGSYYILFVADDNNLVTETNETNNVQSVSISISGVMAINNSIEGEVIVAPNPTEGLFTIESKGAGSDKLQILVYSPLGIEVKNISNANLSTSIDLSGYAAGIYMVKVIKGDKQNMYRVVVE